MAELTSIPIRKKLEEVEKQLLDLGTLRATLQANLNSISDPITSKLPMEIISYIFALYLASESEQSGHNPSGSNISNKIIPCAAPLRLGAVCRRWRNIAWSLPQLWTTLVIRLDAEHHALGPEIVFEWIDRTANRLLHIQVGFNDWSSVEEGETEICADCVIKHGEAVMEILNQCASRWRVLDLTGIPGDSSILQALRYAYSKVEGTSSLDHLLLGDEQCLGEPRTGEEIFPESGLKHSPTHLTILSSVSQHQININWAHITNLEMRYSTYQTCSHTITEFSSGSPLRSLTLANIYRPRNITWGTHPETNLPHLHSLRINETPGHIIQSIIETLRLPSLTTLEFDFGDGPDISDSSELPVRALRNLLKRSECILENLMLYNDPVQDDDLIYLLRGMKTLTTLNIGFWYINDIEILLGALADYNNSKSPPPLLPKLQRLVITGNAPRPWSSLIRIFDDEATVMVDENLPIQKSPKRHNLNIFFNSWSDVTMDDEDTGEEALPDRCSFLKVISLWCDYGIDCSIQYSPSHDLISGHMDFPNAHRLLHDCYYEHFGEGKGDLDGRILNRMRQLPLFG